MPINDLNSQEQELLNEMQTVKKKLGVLDGRVSGFNIDRNKQLDYTIGIFNNQADQSKKSSEQEYEKNIQSWIQSAPSRARLVIVEAEADRLQQLARITFNASPLERVLIVGLTPEMKDGLREELKKLWKERLEKSDINREQFLALSKNNGASGSQNLEAALDSRTVDQLLGPHLQKEDLDITHAKLSEHFPQFDVNLEEVLCFGKSSNLAENLVSLGQNIQTGVPTFSVKSEPFTENDTGLWKCACRDKTEFTDQLALGKSATELIGKNGDEYENIDISPSFQALFDITRLKQEMASQGFPDQIIEKIEKKDLDYLKHILFDEALYPANISPNAITKTISKATSKLGALKATKVANSLKWNLVSRPVSSAVEVEFALGSMTLDGGNDLIKEDLDKKDSYKRFYDNLLHALLDKNIVNPETATKIAFAQTINAYCNIEKNNEVIKELERGQTGAEKWRDLGLVATNRVKKVNNYGVKFLQPLMPLFILGIILGVAGIVLAPIALPAAVSIGLTVVGGLSFIGASTFTGASMYNQIKANKKQLGRANIALAVANAKKYDAQRERVASTSDKLTQIKEKLLDDNGIESLRRFNEGLSSREVNARDVQPNDQEVARQTMLNEIHKIENEEIEIDGRVKGHIDRDKQLEYTMDLFYSQASRSKLTSEIEYEKNIQSWIQSAPSRARLVIVEAEADRLQQLARITFNASPLERVLIVGLTPEMKDGLREELKKLWKERLEKSDINREQFLALSKNNGASGSQNLEAALDSRTVDQLLGPHLQKEDLDITHAKLSEHFPQFDVNLEEVLCFGKSSNLAENLVSLGQNIQTGVPTFSVKSEPFTENDTGLWKCACRDKTEFTDQLALGKSATELIGKNGDEYENIDISPSFQALFDITRLKQEMASQGFPDQIIEKIEKKDLDYLKHILFDEALYPANISPNAITKTISKATSKLGALAGEKVANSLKWNLVGKPASAAVEVNFAIASMTLDGGNDLIKENLDKKTSYKSLFENTLDYFKNEGMSSQEATKKAFMETVRTYSEIEKNDATMQNILYGSGGAEQWRDFGLKITNRTREKANLGIKSLFPLMPLFIVGALLTFGGFVLIPFALPVAAAIAVSAVGLLITLSSVSAIGVSTKNLAKANRDFLPVSNYAFAQANSKMYDAQQIRNLKVNRRLDQLLTNRREQKQPLERKVKLELDIHQSAQDNLSLENSSDEEIKRMPSGESNKIRVEAIIEPRQAQSLQELPTKSTNKKTETFDSSEMKQKEVTTAASKMNGENKLEGLRTPVTPKKEAADPKKRSQSSPLPVNKQTRTTKL